MTPQEIVIPVDSQELADELKSICIKYGLPYDLANDAFDYNPNIRNIFFYQDYWDGFTIGWFTSHNPSEHEINKEQFIELLDNINN